MFWIISGAVAAVKEYMKHERSTLSELTELRTKAVSGNLSDDDTVTVNNKISKTLGTVMVAVERYPDLKASGNFLQLQAAINEIEEQISAARRSYNAAVTDYNNACEMFPTNIMAAKMSYKRKQVFETDETERENVRVEKLFHKLEGEDA